jgi:TolB-like protein/Tfp pilus assembly protein PilF
MAIWSAEIKELERLHESLKGQLPGLEKELEQLIRTEDANVIMLYSRRCLEVIITDLCECELKRSRKTEPLKGIIDKLHKEEKVPSHIISSMYSLNELSTYGTHPKDFDPEQVKPVLINLDIIIKWYLKYKETNINVKPTEEIKHEIKSIEDVKKSILISKKRLIALVSGLFLLIVIVVAVLFFINIISGGKQTKEPEKSIAVLPFLNESPVDSNKYFINGIMEEVLNNLQKIKDFRVLSRTSTDQYKSTDRPTITEIAKALGVSYIVEGSGQKYGNTFRLRVQLLKGKGKENHLWGKSFQQEIRNTTDLFNIQSQIAQSIASELKAVITPEEKQLIEKIPTASLTALEFYQKGEEERKKYKYNLSTREALDRADELYKKALEYDPSFAQAYVGMAQVYWNKHYWETYMSENFLDSVLIRTNKALSIDDKLAEAYTLRGDYYQYKAQYGQAIEEFNKALRYNLNDDGAYFGKGLCFQFLGDYVQCIENFHEALRRYHGQNLSRYLRTLGAYYSMIGFSEKSKYYYQSALSLDGDSASYLYRLAIDKYYNGNFVEALNLAKREMKIDTTMHYTDLEFYYYVPSNYDYEAYLNAKNYAESAEKAGRLLLGRYYRVGYAFWKVGKQEKAEYYFNQQIKMGEEDIKLGRLLSEYSYYELAASYAFFGKKEKAYKYLEEFDKKNGNWALWWVLLIKHDPYFDSFRNEERFQKIQKSVEAKYQAEHERVRKWLEKQGML